MKYKFNPIILIGGIMCLASMLMGFVKFKMLVTLYTINWADAARYLEEVLYVIPIVGVLMIVCSFLDNKIFHGIVFAAAVTVCIWYGITYDNVLDYETIVWMLNSGGALLEWVCEQVGINFSVENISQNDLILIQEVLKSCLRVGRGFKLFIGGTVVTGIGAVLGAVVLGSSGNKTKKAKSAASTGSDDIFNY